MVLALQLAGLPRAEALGLRVEEARRVVHAAASGNPTVAALMVRERELLGLDYLEAEDGGEMDG